MDIAYTASDYPVNGSQVYRLNFLQQFLCEVEYISSPEAVRSLQEVGGCDGSEFQGEIVEWNPNMNITLNYDLCNIFLGELTKKYSDTVSTLTLETNIRLVNLANYSVSNDYLGFDLYFQNYDAYQRDNSVYKITLQGKEVGSSRLNIAVDGLN